MKWDGAPRVSGQPLERVTLMLEQTLGRPPLALMKTPLIGEIARPRGREGRALGDESIARHLECALAVLSSPRDVQTGETGQTCCGQGECCRLRDLGRPDAVQRDAVALEPGRLALFLDAQDD